MQNFLFGPYPFSFQTPDAIFFVSALAALAAALAIAGVLRFAKLSPPSITLLHRFKNLTLFYGLPGLIWAGFRYENALYLNWRFWMAAIAAAAAIWLGFILAYMFKQYPAEKQSWQKKQMKEKYLK